MVALGVVLGEAPVEPPVVLGVGLVMEVADMVAVAMGVGLETEAVEAVAMEVATWAVTGARVEAAVVAGQAGVAMVAPEVETQEGNWEVEATEALATVVAADMARCTHLYSPGR